MTRPLDRRLGWLAVALLALAAACVASVGLGARSVPWALVLDVLTGSRAGSAPAPADAAGTLARAAVEQRIPRTVLALLVGAALALSGLLLQGVTRNPLADPGLLGISPGAALAVVVGIAFLDLSSPSSQLWVALAGAAVAAVVVHGLGSLGHGGATPLRLALAGAVTWAAAGSLTAAVLLPRVDVLDRFRFWQVGGVGGADPARTATVLPFLAAGGLIALATARRLNSLALGDDVAAGLGERVARTRAVAGTGAVLLCGAATAVAGPIAFVGFAVPHLGRMLLGPDHRWLVPFSAVAGAALLTAADVVGRVVARPGEVAAGVVTAFVGAPLLVVVVRRLRVRAL